MPNERRDLEVICPDHPDWRVTGVGAREGKGIADAHDEEAHRGQSVARTQKRAFESAPNET